MIHYIVKFWVWRLSNTEKCGKSKRRVFLDIFSPPENNSGVHLPVKNQFPALQNLWTFAVRHCRRSNCQHQAGGNRRVMGISHVSTTHQTKQSYCTSLHHSNQFNLLNVYSQHSDIIVSVVSFHLAFSLMITFLISIHLCTWY